MHERATPMTPTDQEAATRFHSPQVAVQVVADGEGDGANTECSASEADAPKLEVIVDGETVHRRKASLVPSEALALARTYQNTACFVHALLEEETNKEQTAAGGAARDGPTTELHAPGGGGGRAAGAAAHSRLLTKRQLSDMAWGVRELSKHLGGIRMKLHVQRVFVLTKAHDEELVDNTRELVQWLLAEDDRGVSYTAYLRGRGEEAWCRFVEQTMRQSKRFNAEAIIAGQPSREARLRYWTDDMCVSQPQLFDFIVTLGGDGTVLYASWLFQRIVPPVLSFALGSLGFLTKFDYDKYSEHLTPAFRDGVTVSLRLRFEGTIMRARRRHAPQDEQRGRRDLVDELVGCGRDDDATHKPDGSYVILNDIVVDRGPSPTMSTLELFGDDDHFTTLMADGVCISTPTGSTAYNLAAGGSLCHPENPVICLTAICPHTLSFRPLILPDTVVLRVGVPYDARTNSWASFDGRKRVELHPGDYVTIAASRYPFADVLPPGRRNEDWVSSIRRTLNWNSRERQKAFKEWNEHAGQATTA